MNALIFGNALILIVTLVTRFSFILKYSYTLCFSDSIRRSQKSLPFNLDLSLILILANSLGSIVALYVSLLGNLAVILIKLV